MVHETFAWLQRIKNVEAEHSAANLASIRFPEEVTHDPSLLKKLVTLRDVKAMAHQLEGTYVVRLFAEFETGLRLFWLAARMKEAPNRTAHMLDGIAASRRIPSKILEHAHRVREYRNALIHEREEPVEPISIGDSRGHLCRFFSYLPPRW